MKVKTIKKLMALRWEKRLGRGLNQPVNDWQSVTNLNALTH